MGMPLQDIRINKAARLTTQQAEQKRQMIKRFRQVLKSSTSHWQKQNQVMKELENMKRRGQRFSKDLNVDSSVDQSSVDQSLEQPDSLLTA